LGFHEELFNLEIHRGHPTPHKGGRGFSTVDAYFFLPSDVKDLFESAEIKTLELASCEGPLSSFRKQQTRSTKTRKSGIVG
jgi:hypothetical protein